MSPQEGEKPGLLHVSHISGPISRLTARPRHVLQKAVHFIPGTNPDSACYINYLSQSQEALGEQGCINPDKVVDGSEVKT